MYNTWYIQYCDTQHYVHSEPVSVSMHVVRNSQQTKTPDKVQHNESEFWLRRMCQYCFQIIGPISITFQQSMSRLIKRRCQK